MKTTLNLSTLIVKAALVLTAVVFFASWAGCSDNMNVTDPLSTGHNVQNQPNHTPDPGDGELLWSLNELKVWTVSEALVENKAVYVAPVPVPPLNGAGSYRITFSISSDASRFSNGYEPVARITTDADDGSVATLFEETNSISANGPDKEVKFRDIEFSQIKFYVALFQVDGSQSSIPGNSAYLTLSDIKIYKVR